MKTVQNTDAPVDQTFSVEENRRRRRRFDEPYEPLSGLGCLGERTAVSPPFASGGIQHIPVAMTADAGYAAAQRELNSWERLRCRYDFEFWAARCVTIRDKISGRSVPFVLNNAQRKVLAVLEADRTAHRPLRLILLKARQWGGSTLIQMYMAWIQTCLRRNWNSLICSHIKDTSRSILGMYTSMIANYPYELWDGDETDATPGFRPFERSTNIRELTGRGCRVTVASAESQEALRGSDIAMAHLSETAFWPDTRQKSPLDYMRTVCGSVSLEELTLVVIESTANGTGNFFHDEWQRNVSGRGDKRAVFVAWYEIPIYRVADLADSEARKWWERLTPYEKKLWTDYGLSLEQIVWYHLKAIEYSTADQMKAEFPTTPDEAFVNSGANVFPTSAIERLRSGCREGCEPPAALARYGVSGSLTMWEPPRSKADYIVSVDVGGRSQRADYSVICVMRTRPFPETVAQWRGHIDHDLLADYAEGIARVYNEALLVVESNTLESENMETSSESVLGRMSRSYNRLYCRQAGSDEGSVGSFMRPGFHTNRATKAAMIDHLIAAVRSGGYIEHDAEACNELASYSCLPNGSYAARRGKHDDILMTRAIALYVLDTDYTPRREFSAEDIRRAMNHSSLF